MFSLLQKTGHLKLLTACWWPIKVKVGELPWWRKKGANERTESMQGEKRDEKNRGEERQRNKWNGKKKKAEKEDKICLNDALGRKEKSVKSKKDIGKMQ